MFREGKGHIYRAISIPVIKCQLSQYNKTSIQGPWDPVLPRDSFLAGLASHRVLYQAQY